MAGEPRQLTLGSGVATLVAVAESAFQAKRRLRLEVKERLASIASADASAWSGAICERIAASELFRTAKAIMGYVATPGEADVWPLLNTAWATGKRVCLPRVDWNLRVMSAAEAPRNRQDLLAGRHGITEPTAVAPVMPIPDLDLVIVPGLAFDEQGWRLGRGAGFYDRFLAHPSLTATSIGAAFEVQMTRGLPRDDWDVALHAVATERRWIQVE
jgi:5-formyltetrahydrofolate cyclo-ligase